MTDQFDKLNDDAEREAQQHTQPETEITGIDLMEAARQLELAVHDAQVAYDCISLGKLDLAHTSAITARAAADAAETILRAARGDDGSTGFST